MKQQNGFIDPAIALLAIGGVAVLGLIFVGGPLYNVWQQSLSGKAELNKAEYTRQVAVLEAQAMGCFCVVSDAEGLSENVLNGITGVVIEKRNPKLLSETILNVFRMSIKDKQRIRKQAMERVTKEFNLDVQKQQFIDFYIP
jgi:glycosyltransferase involved in cell wall biosynthesis